MSGATNALDQDSIPEFKQIMGHPGPLWMLFMSEFWERFAFYGIRWALVLYIVAQFHGGDQSGQADANRAINESLTPLLIQFQALQKLADNVTIALIPSCQGLIIDPATLLGGNPPAP